MHVYLTRIKAKEYEREIAIKRARVHKSAYFIQISLRAYRFSETKAKGKKKGVIQLAALANGTNLLS